MENKKQVLKINWPGTKNLIFNNPIIILLQYDMKLNIYSQVLACLKKDIEIGKKIEAQDKYLIVISLPSVHNHAIETSFLNLPVEKSVLKEM